MNHKHRITLQKIFSHPIDTNIDWKKIESLLSHLGAEMNEGRTGRMKVILNGQESVFSMPHHGHSVQDKNEIMQLRHFLEKAGVSPEKK